MHTIQTDIYMYMYIYKCLLLSISSGNHVIPLSLTLPWENLSICFATFFVPVTHHTIHHVWTQRKYLPCQVSLKLTKPCSVTNQETCCWMSWATSVTLKPTYSNQVVMYTRASNVHVWYTTLGNHLRKNFFRTSKFPCLSYWVVCSSNRGYSHHFMSTERKGVVLNADTCTFFSMMAPSW